MRHTAASSRLLSRPIASPPGSPLLRHALAGELEQKASSMDVDSRGMTWGICPGRRSLVVQIPALWRVRLGLEELGLTYLC